MMCRQNLSFLPGELIDFLDIYSGFGYSNEDGFVVRQPITWRLLLRVAEPPSGVPLFFYC